MNRDPEAADRRTQAALWGARQGLEPMEMKMAEHLAEGDRNQPLTIRTYPWVTTKAQELLDALSAARADLAEQHKKRRELERGIEDMERNCSAARAENERLRVLLDQVAPWPSHLDARTANVPDGRFRARAVLALAPAPADAPETVPSTSPVPASPCASCGSDDIGQDICGPFCRQCGWRNGSFKDPAPAEREWES